AGRAHELGETVEFAERFGAHQHRETPPVGSGAATAGLAAPTYRAPDPERSLKAWSEFQDGLDSGRTGSDSEETQ
ncbi:hypothetical protein, partial [Streptomyces niveus]|uniref:hypothetical protein n=1 Tax=Streptomyces niveus TaxID=193462 RepID=UPI0034165463